MMRNAITEGNRQDHYSTVQQIAQDPKWVHAWHIFESTDDALNALESMREAIKGMSELDSVGDLLDSAEIILRQAMAEARDTIDKGAEACTAHG